jgi:hypothetical protein
MEERRLLNSSKFDLPARHSKLIQFLGLMEHVTLNFNSNTPTAAAVYRKDL